MPVYRGTTEVSPAGYKAVYRGTTEIWTSFTPIPVGRRAGRDLLVNNENQRAPSVFVTRNVMHIVEIADGATVLDRIERTVTTSGVSQIYSVTFRDGSLVRLHYLRNAGTSYVVNVRGDNATAVGKTIRFWRTP